MGGNWAASGGNGKLRKQHLLFLLFHTDLPVTRLGVKVLLLLQNMGNVVFFPHEANFLLIEEVL